MGILYNVPDLKTWGIMFFILVVLIALNELGRETKWGGILLFVIVPVVLTIFVWPTTCAPGNEYGTGNWFNWAKTYSALAGCVGFMLMRYIPNATKHKWVICFPPLILAINICEAVFRDFEAYSFHAFADRLAPVPTTHNPKAFFAVSFLSLVVNAAAVIYQFSIIRKNKLNPFKDEIYTDKAFYKKINAENK